ncbi:MAG: hypothetical protein AAFP76_15720 [Bacteroidota bacterium]
MKRILYLALFLPAFICAQEEMSTSEEDTETTEETLEMEGETSINNEPVVMEVEPKPNEDVIYTGDLANGVAMEDLSWAWNSSNACFPATQYHKFTGNHVFFTGIIPPYSEITVTVVPKDPEANLSIYAYEIGANSMRLVPDLPSCIRCEADHKWDRSYRGKTQDHTRVVRNLLALGRPYRMVIGVTGANELREGEFELVISTQSR